MRARRFATVAAEKRVDVVGAVGVAAEDAIGAESVSERASAPKALRSNIACNRFIERFGAHPEDCVVAAHGDQPAPFDLGEEAAGVGAIVGAGGGDERGHVGLNVTPGPARHHSTRRRPI